MENSTQPEELTNQDMSITPWTVSGNLNYNRLISKFGVNPIDRKLIERIEKVSGKPAHPWIIRGLVFAHQDLDKFLDHAESGGISYVYTGRGPSSTMHLGHLLPFTLAKYLQDAFGCVVLIQLSDTEKFLFKSAINSKADLHKYVEYGKKNALDIMGLGFNPNKTFIFSDLEYQSTDLRTSEVIISKGITANQIRSTYGLGSTNNVCYVCSANRTENHCETNAEHCDTNTERCDTNTERCDVKCKENCKNYVENSIDSPAKYDTLQNENPEHMLRKKNQIICEKSPNIGCCYWPVRQAVPAFVSSFSEIFAESLKCILRRDIAKTNPKFAKSCKIALSALLDPKLKKKQRIMCVVPMAIDQAPYFRMAREAAALLQCEKPVTIFSRFLPSLSGVNTKMNSTQSVSRANRTKTMKIPQDTIFLDSTPKQIEHSISRAYSGGGDTMENHIKYGANLTTDVCYHYLLYLEQDIEKLKQVAQNYGSGRMSSGDLKKYTVKNIQDIIAKHRANVLKIKSNNILNITCAPRSLDLTITPHILKKLDSDDSKNLDKLGTKNLDDLSTKNLDDLSTKNLDDLSTECTENLYNYKIGFQFDHTFGFGRT